MSEAKKPIWTDKQVANLKAYQENPQFHPFTCGNRHLPGHKEYAEKNGLPDHGILVPTPHGWVCPVCDYTQNWAHDFMLNGNTKK